MVVSPAPDAGVHRIAAGLVTVLRRTGKPAVGIKPVDVECPYAEDHDLRSPDGELLWHASDRALPPLVAAPYRFAGGGSPVEAAAAAGLELRLQDILGTIQEALQFGQPVVVLMPPLGAPVASDGDAWDAAGAVSASVLVVVDPSSIDQLGALLAGARQRNLPVLSLLLGTEPGADVPFIPETETDLQRLADHLEGVLEGARFAH